MHSSLVLPTLVACAVADTERPTSQQPKMASALTAALQSGQTTQKQGTTTYPGVSVARSAFPCLYQDEASKEDAFEIDLSLNKLSLGTSPLPASWSRRSLDGNVDPLPHTPTPSLYFKKHSRNMSTYLHLRLTSGGCRRVQQVSPSHPPTFCPWPPLFTLYVSPALNII